MAPACRKFRVMTDTRESVSAGPAGDALELQAFHDAWFDQAEANGQQVYGSSDDWSPVLRSGHFRRMELVNGLIPDDLVGKTAVDFGSGPWGFACIVPKLRTASNCVCIDVSRRALELSKQHNQDIAHKIQYYVSDGETIPLPNDSVDVFWGGEVIEHVRFPLKFMQEIARVCKDSAVVVLTTPNRDALLYRANGEENTCGPEHIALLNHNEFAGILGAYLRQYSILGYELSIYGDLDELPYSANELESLQLRALHAPDISSGMIACGVVDKALYRKNARALRLRELSWREFGAVQGQVSAVPLFFELDGGALEKQAYIRAKLPGERLALLFWSHDWSGVVEVTVNGECSRIDLYSPGGGFRRCEFVSMNGSFDVNIHRIDEHRPKSRDSQVILYKAMTFA
jgi:SAM-dependent methyltransferase